MAVLGQRSSLRKKRGSAYKHEELVRVEGRPVLGGGARSAGVTRGHGTLDCVGRRYTQQLALAPSQPPCGRQGGGLPAARGAFPAKLETKKYLWVSQR